jgi:multiple sugar transport system substrate-binding protein
MVKKFWVTTATVFLAAVLALTGCNSGTQEGAAGAGGNDSAKTSEPKKAEPVTLKVYVTTDTNLTDEEVQKYVVNSTKEAYPNITLQVEKSSGKSVPDAVQERLAAGDFPDVLVTTLNVLDFEKSLQIPADLNPLLKAQNIDLAKFDPVAINYLKSVGDQKQLDALPLYLNYSVLFYNKAIFDKFGIGYPKDGMTWDDAITLAKKLTRNDGGVQYYGLHPGNILNLGYMLSQPLVNPKSNVATLDTDGWKKSFGLLKEVFDIPGNRPEQKDFGNGRNMFLKDRNLAMLADWGNGLLGQARQLNDGGGNWDMVTIPNVAGRTGIGRNVDFHIVMVSSQSKHKPEATQVLSVLTSKDVQSKMNKDGRYTSLADPELQKQFGADLEILKGKHTAAIYNVKAADTPVPTKYDGLVKPPLNSAATNVIYKGDDINTALRQADETANQQIKTALSQ